MLVCQRKQKQNTTFYVAKRSPSFDADVSAVKNGCAARIGYPLAQTRFKPRMDRLPVVSINYQTVW